MTTLPDLRYHPRWLVPCTNLRLLSLSSFDLQWASRCHSQQTGFSLEQELNQDIRGTEDMKTHHLFISHSWSYSDQYQRLIKLLEKRSYFNFKDYSVPRDDPIHDKGTDEALKEAIRQKMSPCGVVLILAGVYATHSKWILKEIELAERGFKVAKPIVAIEPWASSRASVAVREAASRVVGWNTESVVRAIRELS